jgi:hypothetical protein
VVSRATRRATRTLDLCHARRSPRSLTPSSSCSEQIFGPMTHCETRRGSSGSDRSRCRIAPFQRSARSRNRKPIGAAGATDERPLRPLYARYWELLTERRRATNP